MHNAIAKAPWGAAWPGMGYGLRQPMLRLAFALSLPAPCDLAALAAPTEAIFVDGLRDGSAAATPRSLVDYALLWTMRMQRSCNVPVFETGRVLSGQSRDALSSYVVALPYAPQRSKAAYVAMCWALEWVVSLASPCDARADPSADFVQSLDAIRQQITPFGVHNANSVLFLEAAHRSEIPWDLITNTIYQFGWGSQSRWMSSSLTERTGAIAASLARDKLATAEVLRRFGLPAPQHHVARTTDDAVSAARQLGYPVVVKPADLDGGVGVSAGLEDDDQVRRAFVKAQTSASRILVEKHVCGRDYRMQVFDGVLVGTTWRQPASVTGDGCSSISALIERTNADPRRGTLAGSALKKIEIDDEATELLASAGLGLDSVPEPGRVVVLRRAANVASGGVPVPVDDDVHPDNRALAEDTCRVLRLDLAGLDLIIPDIAVSWRAGGAVISEVNAQPQLSRAQDEIYKVILDKIVPAGGRIPIVVLVGTGSGDIARLLQAQLSVRQSNAGLVDTTAQLDGQAVNLVQASRALLGDPAVDALIVCIHDAASLGLGVAFDRIDLLWIGAGPHLSDDRLAETKRLLGFLLGLPVGATIVGRGVGRRLDLTRLPALQEIDADEPHDIAMRLSERLVVS